jgi:geranylgeranyl diphosphate synthase, type II
MTLSRVGQPSAIFAQTGVSQYLRAPAAEYLERGGKGLRPALCLATCTAFGGEVEDGLPSAAAIELLHTAFLVHDDVEDDTDLWRGEPTLHRKYGSGTGHQRW